MKIILAILQILCLALLGESLFEEYPETALTKEEIAKGETIVLETTIRMTPVEVSLFYRYLSKSKKYFEFGSGGSTMVASRYGPENLSITSVDSSQEWLDIVANNSYSSDKIRKGQLNLRFVDIGPIGDWGFPTLSEKESKGAWYLYSQAITMVPGPFDLVLVDGRFRVACLLHTLVCFPSAKVLIHDFFEKVHHLAYNVLLQVTKVVDRSDTLAVLERKDGVSNEELMKMYATFFLVASRK
jgi:protein O-GlcNAc transferase